MVTFMNAGMLPKLKELEASFTTRLGRFVTEHLRNVLRTIAILGVATEWVTTSSDVEKRQINNCLNFIHRMLSKEIAPVEQIGIRTLNKLSSKNSSLLLKICTH